MTTTAPEVVPSEGDAEEPSAPGPRRWPGFVLLGVCVVVVLGAALRVAVHDPTDQPVSGDQAAFTLQALSIAGGDLSYDDEDHERWVELGWEPQPRGLFFQQRDTGWAFAKPYGYSLVLAPVMAVSGADAISYVNATLLLAYAACWYGIGRARWRPAGAAFVAAVAAVGSNAWLMSFPAHADVFLAVLVGVAVLGSVRLVFGPAMAADGTPRAGVLSPWWSLWWGVVAAGAAGFIVTEKLPAVVAVAPLLAVGLWRSPWRTRVVAGVVGALVVAVSVVPYIHYSDGSSWNAYGGDRYYTPGATPWSGGTEDELVAWRTRDTVSPGRVIDRLLDPSDDLPSAAHTYAVGRHTGAITYQPIVGALLVVSVGAGLWRWRRARRSRERDRVDRADAADGAQGDPADPGDRAQHGRSGPLRLFHGATWAARNGDLAVEADDQRERAVRWALGAAVVGLAGYIGLYLVSFTDNYFGGGQSVGNRYFLQVSVLVAVIPVAAGVGERTVRWAAAAAGVAAWVLLHPHFLSPEEAFYHLERTSPTQEWLLPFDDSQSGNWRFRCDPDLTCDGPPITPYPG